MAKGWRRFTAAWLVVATDLWLGATFGFWLGLAIHAGAALLILGGWWAHEQEGKVRDG